MSTGNEKIREIIKGLLRLAMNSGATEAEKATALGKARELMAKYAIEIEEGEEHDEPIVKADWVLGDWAEKWHQIAVHAVAALHSCRVVTGTGRADGRKSAKPTGAYRFVGRASDCEMAADTMRWVFEQIEMKYKETLKGLTSLPEWKDMDESSRKWLRGNVRKSFKEGAAQRLLERAMEIMEMLNGKTLELEHDTSKAVAIVDARFAAADAMLADHKSVVLRESRPGFGTAAGRAAGNTIELNKGVGQNVLSIEDQRRRED